MIFHHDIFLQVSTSFIQIDTSPNYMFFQGSSSLSDFCQSPHIFPGDLLVTSSWPMDDNSLLTWLHFMIYSSLHLLYSQELPVSSSLFAYNHLIFHMRTYLISFVSGNLCTRRDPPSQIIVLKIKFHYLQPYDMTSQHLVSAHKYVPHTFFL